MDFEYNEKTRFALSQIEEFMDKYIYPHEETYYRQIDEGDRWEPPAILDELKAKAREAGLWLSLIHI